MEPDNATVSPEADMRFEAEAVDSLEDSSALRRELRMARVIEYQAQSLQKFDALEACIAAINSGLMLLADEMEMRIAESLSKSPPNLEAIAKVLPAIDAQLRVTKQIDRFAQFDVRAGEARSRAAARPRADHDQLRSYKAKLSRSDTQF